MSYNKVMVCSLFIVGLCVIAILKPLIAVGIQEKPRIEKIYMQEEGGVGPAFFYDDDGNGNGDKIIFISHENGFSLNLYSCRHKKILDSQKLKNDRRNLKYRHKRGKIVIAGQYKKKARLLVYKIADEKIINTLDLTLGSQYIDEVYVKGKYMAIVCGKRDVMMIYDVPRSQLVRRYDLDGFFYNIEHTKGAEAFFMSGESPDKLFLKMYYINENKTRDVVSVKRKNYNDNMVYCGLGDGNMIVAINRSAALVTGVSTIFTYDIETADKNEIKYDGDIVLDIEYHEGACYILSSDGNIYRYKNDTIERLSSLRKHGFAAGRFYGKLGNKIILCVDYNLLLLYDVNTKKVNELKGYVVENSKSISKDQKTLLIRRVGEKRKAIYVLKIGAP